MIPYEYNILTEAVVVVGSCGTDEHNFLHCSRSAVLFRSSRKGILDQSEMPFIRFIFLLPSTEYYIE